MSTYPLRKLIPDARMASVCFLLPLGSQMIYFRAKKNSPSPWFVCTLCTLVMQCHPPPQVPLSPLSDPMLFFFFFFFFYPSILVLWKRSKSEFFFFFFDPSILVLWKTKIGATMAFFFFFYPSILVLWKKKNSPSPLFVCTLCTLVMQCHFFFFMPSILAEWKTKIGVSFFFFFFLSEYSRFVENQNRSFFFFF